MKIRFFNIYFLVFLIGFGTALADASLYPYGDREPFAITGVPPRAYPVHGIDLSRYQSDVDWQRVAASGIKFAYIKATEGTDIVDPNFYNHVTPAIRAGIRVGAYHFYHFCSSPQAQARRFIATVPKRSGWMPPVIDLEINHRSRCQRQLDYMTFRREIGTFMKMLESHYGQRPIIYTTPDYYRNNQLDRFGGEEFWLRSTAGNPALTYPGQDWVFWQYTGTGSVPGIRGNVDINAFVGYENDWARFLELRQIR